MEEKSKNKFLDINQEFFNRIEPILIKLKKKIGPDFIIFGSAPLYLLGVLDFNNGSEFNDLDVAVKDESVIPKKEAKEVCFKGDPSQRLYKINIDGVNIDIGSAWPEHEEIFNRIFENPVIVQGFKFANLDICEEWRKLVVKKYDNEKAKYHLEKIKEFREKIINN
jgi:hypothetical protein